MMRPFLIKKVTTETHRHGTLKCKCTAKVEHKIDKKTCKVCKNDKCPVCKNDPNLKGVVAFCEHCATWIPQSEFFEKHHHRSHIAYSYLTKPHDINADFRKIQPVHGPLNSCYISITVVLDSMRKMINPENYGLENLNITISEENGIVIEKNSVVGNARPSRISDDALKCEITILHPMPESKTEKTVHIKVRYELKNPNFKIDFLQPQKFQ
jgi:hypothetical protein